MIRLFGLAVEYLLQRFGSLRLIAAAVCLLFICGLLMSSGTQPIQLLGGVLMLPVGLTIAVGVPFGAMRSIRRRSPTVGAFIDGRAQYRAWWLVPIRVLLLVIPAVLLAIVGVLALAATIALAVALGRTLHIH